MVYQPSILHPRNYKNTVKPGKNFFEKLYTFGDIADYLIPQHNDFTDKLGPITKMK